MRASSKLAYLCNKLPPVQLDRSAGNGSLPKLFGEIKMRCAARLEPLDAHTYLNGKSLEFIDRVRDQMTRFAVPPFCRHAMIDKLVNINRHSYLNNKLTARPSNAVLHRGYVNHRIILAILISAYAKTDHIMLFKFDLIANNASIPCRL